MSVVQRGILASHFVFANDTERSGLKLESRASFHSHKGLHNTAKSGKLLIFRYGSGNNFFFLFNHKIDIRGKPVRPGRAVTVFDGLFHSQFKRYEVDILTQL